MEYVSYTKTEDSDNSYFNITYVGTNKEAAIRAVQLYYNGSMTQTCTMYLETWVGGRRSKTEQVKYKKGSETERVR